jgi:chromate transport protein ChrA
MASVSFAISKNWVPNVELTIMWSRVGIRSFAEVDRAFKQLRDAYLHWCQKRGLPCVHYWSIEHGPQYGLHSHMGAWLPVAWNGRFHRWLKDWLLRCMRRQGLPVEAGHRDLPSHTLGLSIRRNGLLLSHWRWFCHCVQGVDGRALGLLEWEMGSAVAIKNGIDHSERLELPLLREATVTPGWVSDDTFLAGYGAAQAVPGPLFTFAAYLGAVMKSPPNGIAGAAISLVAIFLPGILALMGALPFWETLRRRSDAQAIMRGVNAAARILVLLFRKIPTSLLTAQIAVIALLVGIAHGTALLAALLLILGLQH